MKVNIDSITIDPRLQSRAAMNEEAVEEYAEAIRAGVKFDPVFAFEEGETLWLVEGFHRVKAHIVAGVNSIDIETKVGTFRDAWVYSLGTNKKHGARRTNADKRKVILSALSDADMSAWPDRELAAHLGVSATLLATVKKELANPEEGAFKSTSHKSLEVLPKKEAAPVSGETAKPQATEKRAPAPEPEPDGPDVEELATNLEEAIAESESLRRRVTALEADDSEVMRQFDRAEQAERARDDAMTRAAKLQERVNTLGRFQAKIFSLTKTDTHAAAVKVIEGWKPA